MNIGHSRKELGKDCGYLKYVGVEKYHSIFILYHFLDG